MVRASVVSVVLLFVAILEACGADVLAIVADGEVGGADVGQLITINPSSATFSLIGSTGINNVIATAFHPQRGLIAGTSRGEIFLIDSNSASATSEVDTLLRDPNPPPGTNFVGVATLLGFDFHPVSGELFAIITDVGSSYFLAKLDLNRVDQSNRFNKTLEIEIVGLMGSRNGGNVGFQVNTIGFNRETGDLFGAGTDLTGAGQPPVLIQIQTRTSPSLLATKVDDFGDLVSFPRGMAFTDGRFLLTGFQRLGDGTVRHVLYRYNPVSEQGSIVGSIRRLGTPVAGTVNSLSVVPDFTGGGDPNIFSFTPAGGSCGTIVRIRGSGFTGVGNVIVDRVEFDGVASLGDPIVFSNDELFVVAPSLFRAGRITVTTRSAGVTKEAISPVDFQPSDLVIIQLEASQTLPEDPWIAGKDGVIRLLTASSGATSTTSIPAVFGHAVLNVTRPNGTQFSVTADHYTSAASNPATTIEPGERHNINFFVSGEDFHLAGTYQLQYVVRGFEEPGQAGCPIVAMGSSTLDVLPARSDLTVLVMLGVVKNGDQLIWPDQETMEAIPRVFDEFSRVYPIRNGVSRLGQDLSAGVRFELATHGVEVSDEGPGTVKIGKDLFNGVDGSAEKVLDEYNDKNFDRADYVAVFVADEQLFRAANRQLATPQRWPAVLGVGHDTAASRHF